MKETISSISMRLWPTIATKTMDASSKWTRVAPRKSTRRMNGRCRGPYVPYDVAKTHSATLDMPDADMASEAANHEVAMREATRKAGFISQDAYYNITSPVRTPD